MKFLKEENNMSRKLKIKCYIAIISWPLCLFILAPGWLKVIGILEFVYIAVSAVCTWIDEVRDV